MNYCPQCKRQYILEQTTIVREVGIVDETQITDVSAEIAKMREEIDKMMSDR
jgi:hypothetical protein